MRSVVPVLVITLLIVPVPVTTSYTLEAAPKIADEKAGVQEFRMVVGHAGPAPSELVDAAERIGGRLVRTDPVLGFSILEVPEEFDPMVLELAESTEGVRYAKPDERVEAALIPADPLYADQWGPATIGLPAAWEIGTGKHDVVVTVIDTGIDPTHPDLAENVCRLGPDFVNLDDDPFDDHFHGTHVAGTVAGVLGNGLGVSGMGNVCIWATKVLDERGSGWFSDTASAIVWATDSGTDIISMSLGGCPGCDPGPPTTDAVRYAEERDVLLVAAAGNAYCEPVGFPAAYPEVVAVGALAPPDAFEPASFTSCGTEVEVSAPGQSIISSVPAHFRESGYEYLSGTSMATPHVSGVAALVLSEAPQLSKRQLRSLLSLTAVDVGSPGRDDATGQGRIDAASLVATTCSPRPPAKPTLETFVGDATALLFWTPPVSCGGPVLSYEVHRGDSSSTLTPLATLPGDATSFRDSNVQEGESYTYGVRARNAAGAGQTGVGDPVLIAPPLVVPYSLGFEDGLEGWTTSGIGHLTTDRAVGQGSSFYFGAENGPGLEDNSYDLGRPVRATLRSPAIRLPEHERLTLDFWNHLDVAPIHRPRLTEHARLEIATDADPRAFTDLWGLSVPQYEGAGVVNLSGYAGKVLYLRFVFDTTDQWDNSYEGWYVDDLRIAPRPAPNAPPFFSWWAADVGNAAGEVQFVGYASDGNGDADVHRVEFRIDGGPWSFTEGFASRWEGLTSGIASGDHTMDVRVIDAEGRSESESRLVVLDLDPPVVTIARPMPGDEIGCNLEIEVNASDARGLRWVQYRVTGEGVGRGQNEFFEGENLTQHVHRMTLFSLNAGDYRVEVEASDGELRGMDVVNNLTLPNSCRPEITILSPEPEARVRGIIGIEGTVDFHDLGAGQIVARLDDHEVLNVGAEDGPWSFDVDTRFLEPGFHLLVVEGCVPDPVVDFDHCGMEFRWLFVENLATESYFGRGGCSVAFQGVAVPDSCGGENATVTRTLDAGFSGFRARVNYPTPLPEGMRLRIVVEVGGQAWSSGEIERGVAEVAFSSEAPICAEPCQTTIRVSADGSSSPDVVLWTNFRVDLTWAFWGAAP